MISLNVVVQLIKRAASRLFIACTQNNNNTALFHGAECGRAEVLKLLLDKGANIEAKNFASPPAWPSVESVHNRDHFIR